MKNQSSPLATIAKIQYRTSLNKSIENRIEKREADLKRELDGYKNEIENNNKQIASMQKEKVYAKLSSIVQVLAYKWGVSPSKITIDYNTNFDFDTMDYEVSDFLKIVDDIKSSLPLITKTLPITITISAVEGKNKKVILPTSEIELISKQDDGKTLLEHITPKFSILYAGRGRVEIKINKIDSLILPFGLNQLCTHSINGDFQVKNPLTDIILESAQEYYLEQSQRGKE